MSGSTTVGGISIPITAVDTATPVIARLNQSIAGLALPTRRLGQNTQAAFNANPVHRLTQGMRSLGGAAQDVFRSVERTVPLLGVLSAGSFVGGIAALEKHYAGLGQAVANTATRLGLTTTSLTTWQGAARLGGASAEDMTAGLTSLDEKMRSATFRGDGNAIQAFRILGVSFGEIGVKARRADDAMGDFAEGFKRVNDTQGRGAALRLAQILGQEALFPQLIKGRGAWNAWRKDAEQLGATLTPAMVGRAEALHNAFTRVGMAIGGFANRIADALAPTVTPLLNQLATWIGKNSKWIADELGGLVKTLHDKGKAAIDEIKSWDWEGARKGAQNFLKDLQDIAKENFAEVKAGAEKIKEGFNWIDDLGKKWDAWVAKMHGMDAPKEQKPIGEQLHDIDEWMNWMLRDLPGRLGAGFREALGGAATWLFPEIGRPSRETPTGPRAAISVPQAPTAAAGRMRHVHDFYTERGVPEYKIAGILANMAAEDADFDPAKLGDHGTSLGVFQEHAANMDALVKKYGAQPTLDQELLFAWDQPEFQKALRQMDGRTTEQGGAIFSRVFEGPAGGMEEDARRGAAAPQFMQGHVQVDVTVGGNVPRGTTAQANSGGIAVASTPRVGRAMPAFGQ